MVSGSATADELGAADMVAYQLGRTNGTTYQVVSDDAVPESGELISIGITTLASDLDTSDLGAWGRRLDCRGRCLRVVSGSRPESIWAAADLMLERCGIRHYGPDPLWVSTPDRVRSLPGDAPASRPAVQHYSYSNCWKPNRLPYSISPLWQRFAMEHESHTFGRLLSVSNFAAHPDITPTYGGVDVVPTAEMIASCASWQPCMHYTATLADALMPAILASLETHEAIQVSVCDAGGYCECDECVADIIAAGGSVGDDWRTTIPGYSAQYHALLAEIAGRVRAVYPTARVVGLAYAQVAGLPVEPLPEGIDLLNTVERPAAPLSLDDDYEDRVAAWQARAGWSVYDRLHGADSVHPCLIAGHYQRKLAAHTPRQIVIEGSPSWGLMLAQPYILARLAWDPSVSVTGLWAQWAADLFGSAAPHVLDYVAAVRALTWAAATPPPAQHADVRAQLAPGPGQVDAVAAATAALAAAQSTPGLTADQSARLSIIATAWDVPRTLVLWSNRETPPSAAAEAAFRARFAAVEADNRTLWRRTLDGLQSWVRRSADYAARRLSEYEWPVVVSEVRPATGRWVALPDLGESWRVDWTTTRGEVPGRARLNFRDDTSDSAFLTLGRWRDNTWQWVTYIGDPITPHYQETAVEQSVVQCSLVATGGWWRVFVDGRQLMGAEESTVRPTRYYITTTGDETVTDLVVRSETP